MSLSPEGRFAEAGMVVSMCRHGQYRMVMYLDNYTSGASDPLSGGVGCAKGLFGVLYEPFC